MLRALACLLIVPVIAGLSVALCAALWGEVRPVCARAWRMRAVPFWGRWVDRWDRRLAWVEDRHCERSSERWPFSP